MILIVGYERAAQAYMREHEIDRREAIIVGSEDAREARGTIPTQIVMVYGNVLSREGEGHLRMLELVHGAKRVWA
jgi:hypothetical protein